MHVRAYERPDAPAVARLLSEMGYPTSAERAAAFADRFVQTTDAALLLATIDGEVVGLIATCLVPRLDEDQVSCRITDLIVASSRRRQGVGTVLVEAAVTAAYQAGAGRIDLSTGDWRCDAHAFYESVGFRDNARALVRRLRYASQPATRHISRNQPGRPPLLGRLSRSS